MSEIQREIIATDAAPSAVGNYNQGIVVSGGRTAYLSGQIGMVPGKPELGVPGDVEQQTRQVMTNITSVLAGAGMDRSNIVRATIYLASMGDFSKVDAIYGEHFEAGTYPSRVTVEAAGLPKGALVEISVIAVG